MRLQPLFLFATLRSARALLAAQQAARPPADKLPPLSYVCTMAGDEDVIEDKPGVCRKCGMELKPTRLDSVWTCATRPLLVVESKPGKCPVDGTPLVQVTAAVSWTCADQPSIEKLEPGTCAERRADDQALRRRARTAITIRSTAASSSWRPTTGTTSRARISRPACSGSTSTTTSPSRCRSIRCATWRRAIVTKQTFDAATKTTKELAAAPLVRNGRFLEARIGKLALPAQMTAKISFKKGGPEHVFDFAFEGFSKEPPRGNAARPPRRRRRTPAPEPRRSRRSTSGEGAERSRSRRPWRTR